MRPRRLLEKYLAGAATYKELEELLEYIRNHPEEKFNATNERLWSRIKEKNTHEERLDSVYGKISARLKTDPGHTFKKSRNYDPAFYGLKIAASLLIFAIAGYFVFSAGFFDRKIEKQPPTAKVVKSNPAGLKSKIYLPDGSIVLLNSESVLEYPERFDSLHRTVHLEGEAYFEVVKKENCPFRVVSGAVTTTALGTSFNVNAFADEEAITVALTSGKVAVTNNKDTSSQILLDPGLGLRFDREKRVFNQFRYDPRKVLSWKEGIIVFNQADQEEVFETLRRWYGVNFTFENGSQDPKWNYSGEFNDEYLENILESIGFTKSFDFTIDNKEVAIIFH